MKREREKKRTFNLGVWQRTCKAKCKVFVSLKT
uniref:Uncharacterized protein n=1 Tax=Rhizophora mucronata TaxID=61149 RepID=A0A2P2JGL2_RHIMU